ncbi:MAG TPA: iron-containing alcohol dehydrogenase [Solirubrobacteraceae bacterium]|jgi:maleylacetate reductase
MSSPIDTSPARAGPTSFEALAEICAAVGEGPVELALALPSGQRVELARGSRSRLPAIVRELSDGPVGVVAGASQVAAGHIEALSRGLGEPLRCFAEVRPHATAELCARAAAELDGCAIVVGFGGGSALGIAKHIVSQLGASGRGVPLVAVPTTYAGSELTMLYGVTTQQRKHVRSDPAALPAAIVYDPELTDGLAPSIAGASLLNCLAHCVECAWGEHAGEPIALVAAAGASMMADGLQLLRDPGWAAEGRDRLLLAALCGGLSLASGGTGVHHAICHAIGGRTGASHGDINAIVLPAVLAAVELEAQLAAAPLIEPLRALLDVGQETSDADVLRLLRSRWGLPGRLSELGLGEAKLPALAREILDDASMQKWSAAWDIQRLTRLMGDMK